MTAALCISGVVLADVDARVDRRGDDARTLQMHRDGVRDIREREKREEKKPPERKERDARPRDDRRAGERK